MPKKILIVAADYYEEITKNESTKNNEGTSPSITEDKQEIQNEISRIDLINKTDRIKVENNFL